MRTRQSIAWRFGVINIIFFILMAVTLITVIGFMAANITKTVSGDYAHFYSLETVNRLNLFLIPEIVLVDKISRSGKLADWFTDENNINKKIAAFEEMIILGDMLFSCELYFVIHNSLNEYSIDISSGVRFEDFVPFDVIDPEIEYNQWYYKCISSQNNYSLNIDIDKVTDQRRLWINHKVEQDGKILGVFCSGLLFDDVVENMFGQYDLSSVRSIVINENGIIQMDSTLLGDEHLLLHEEELRIHDTIPDTVFLSTIEKYLNKNGKMFTIEDEPVILRLGTGRHSYLSLTPIINTNWTVITLFNPESLFKISDLYPLLIASIAALLMYAVFLSFLNSRLIFTPFRKLIDNFADPEWINKSKYAFGHGLQNEFGDILKTIESIRLMLDMTPISCTLWNSNLEIINCNREAIKLFKTKDREELRKSFAKLSPEFQPDGSNSNEMTSKYLRKAFDEGYFRTEWMHRTRNGESLPCEVILIRLKHRDEYILAAYTRDLREQKAYLAEIENARDAAEEASRAKSSFLATMSHEIRTPMNIITGLAKLARDNDDQQTIKECLGKISENADWLYEIINDVFDISKIESGKMELECVPFDLRDILDHCQTVNIKKAEEKGLDLLCNIDLSIEGKLIGDPARLKQALFNLLSNAIKFTNSGVVNLAVSVKNQRLDDSKVTIYFEIKDTGIGIKSDQLAKIFKPFTQGDDTITRKYGGTGLGLSITKSIIEMMGGTLKVESTPGTGSKFSFELTFDTADVDDDTSLLKRLQALLEAGNAECLNLVGKLKAIPGMEEVVSYIEDYEFEQALKVLRTMFA